LEIYPLMQELNQAWINEASLSGFLRMLFWFFVISFLLRWMMRMYFTMNTSGKSNGFRKEGEVTVEQKTKTRSIADEGEYVDFIEIKDDKK